MLADRVEYRVGLLQQHFDKNGTWAAAVESLRAAWRNSFDEWQADFDEADVHDQWCDALSLAPDALRADEEALKAMVMAHKIG